MKWKETHLALSELFGKLASKVSIGIKWTYETN